MRCLSDSGEEVLERCQRYFGEMLKKLCEDVAGTLRVAETGRLYEHKDTRANAEKVKTSGSSRFHCPLQMGRLILVPKRIFM